MTRQSDGQSVVSREGGTEPREPRWQIQRLVVTGMVLVDWLVYLDRTPTGGAATTATGFTAATGGGFNILAAARRLGLPAAYGGRVGSGFFGRQVLEDFAREGIVCLLPAEVGQDTGFDIGLIEARGENSYISIPGVEAHLRLDDLRSLALEPGDAIYVSGYDFMEGYNGEPLVEWLHELPEQFLVVFDPGPVIDQLAAGWLESLLRRSDLLTLNRREATILTGTGDVEAELQECASRIRASGWVVLRDGAEGCWLQGPQQGPPAHIPARPPTHVVDTTGAGDTHLGALLAWLARGNDFKASAWAANVAASISIERSGPATCPSRSELEAALTTHGDVRPAS